MTSLAKRRMLAWASSKGMPPNLKALILAQQCGWPVVSQFESFGFRSRMADLDSACRSVLASLIILAALIKGYCA